jgi:hypothetical protein
MPWMTIYLLEDNLWHYQKDGEFITECNQELDEYKDSMAIGSLQERKTPPYDAMCKKCFPFWKKAKEK